MQELLAGVLQLDVQLQHVRPVFMRGVRAPLVRRAGALADHRVHVGELRVQVVARRVKLGVQLGQLYPTVQRPVQVRPVVLQRDRLALQVHPGLRVDVRQRRQIGRVHQRVDVDPSGLQS